MKTTIIVMSLLTLQGCSLAGAIIDDGLNIDNEHQYSLANAGAEIDGAIIKEAIANQISPTAPPKNCNEVHIDQRAECRDKVKQLNQHLSKYTKKD